MFQKPNKKTLNNKFIKTGDYSYKAERITKEELEKARKEAKKGTWMALGRSCWECNSAHVHLIDRPNINCFSCGKFYHYGVDVTDYSGSELEKFVKFKITNKNMKLKFRYVYKNKAKAILIEFFTIKDLEDYDESIDTNTFLSNPYLDLIARNRFIGLTDKKGVEIYKGDIVLGKFDVDEVEDWIWMNLTEKEKKTGEKLFRVDDIHFGYKYPVPDNLEVIGNIYKDKKLLNQ